MVSNTLERILFGSSFPIEKKGRSKRKQALPKATPDVVSPCSNMKISASTSRKPIEPIAVAPQLAPLVPKIKIHELILAFSKEKTNPRNSICLP